MRQLTLFDIPETKETKNMTWLDLYNYLNEQANSVKNHGKFPWQENVEVFDFETLEYYPTDFIQFPDNKISLSIDSNKNNDQCLNKDQWNPPEFPG